MANYRAIVHYHFKRGMEAQGIRFLENELVRKAQEYGCHGIELLFNEKDPTQVLGIANWNSVEEARRFQSHWESKEKELLHFCTNIPKREFYKLRKVIAEKSRRVA